MAHPLHTSSRTMLRLGEKTNDRVYHEMADSDFKNVLRHINQLNSVGFTFD